MGQAPEDEVVHAAMHSLFRVFAPYAESGAVFRGAGPATASATAAVQRWLHDKFVLFVDDLLAKLSHSEPGIQVRRRGLAWPGLAPRATPPPPV